MSALRIAKAVAAGLMATWFMDRGDELIYAAQSEAVHRREAELGDVTARRASRARPDARVTGPRADAIAPGTAFAFAARVGAHASHGPRVRFRHVARRCAATRRAARAELVRRDRTAT